jgi:hypothetical protein
MSDQDMAKHSETYPAHWEIYRLEGELGFKWYANFDIDWPTRTITLMPYTNPEVIWIGSAPTLEGYEGGLRSDTKKYPQLEWLPYPNSFDKAPSWQI